MVGLDFIRISGTTGAPRARSVNPARGDLLIVPGPQNVCQTPLGVACESSALLGHRARPNRPPLTGFGNIITCAGYYKQATPNGVLGQPARESKNAYNVQRVGRALLCALRLAPGVSCLAHRGAHKSARPYTTRCWLPVAWLSHSPTFNHTPSLEAGFETRMEPCAPASVTSMARARHSDGGSKVGGGGGPKSEGRRPKEGRKSQGQSRLAERRGGVAWVL
jgi:hypothetical protein